MLLAEGHRTNRLEREMNTVCRAILCLFAGGVLSQAVAQQTLTLSPQPEGPSPLPSPQYAEEPGDLRPAPPLDSIILPIAPDDSSSMAFESMEPGAYQVIHEQTSEEKARQRLRAEIRSQGDSFTKEFVKLDLYGTDFPRQFGELIAKYPLAPLDSFAGKLTERAYRILRAGHQVDEHGESFSEASRILKARILEMAADVARDDELIQDENLLSLRDALKQIESGQALGQSR